MKKIEHRHLEDVLKVMVEIIQHGYYIDPYELIKIAEENSDSYCAGWIPPQVEDFIGCGKNKIIN